MLPLAEFSHNNHVSETTHVSPFFTNYGCHAHFSVNLEGTCPTSLTAKNYATNLQELHDLLCCEIKYAQASQAKQADKHCLPTPMFQIGDEVWLSRRHIRTNPPSQQLDCGRLGRFKIYARGRTHAYKQDHPPTMKVHSVFHISLLEPTHNDPIPGHVPPAPHPVIVVGEEEWDVEEVIYSPCRNRKLQYLVAWVAYDAHTWEPLESFTSPEALAVVNAFHTMYPSKPK